MDVDQGSNAGEEDESEEGEDDEDRDAAEDDDDSVDSEIEADMDLVTGEEGSGAGNIDDLPTLRELLQQAVPQLIRLSTIPVNDEEARTIQILALEALNNVAWTISSVEFANGENANIFSAWYPVAKKIWRKTIAPILDTDSADTKLATVITGLAWAVALTLKGETPSELSPHRKFISLFQAISGTDLHHQGEESEPQDPFQALPVKCIGVLGSLAHDPAPHQVNREVGVFLVALLGKEDAPPAVIVEALNQLFDVYGNEDAPCDKEVFWKDGFIKHLEEFLPKMRALTKAIDKRTQTELRTRADEALLNLGRFVQYKKKHAPK
jgi:hypothetical protein